MGKKKVNCCNPFNFEKHKTIMATNKVPQNVLNAVENNQDFNLHLNDPVCIACLRQLLKLCNVVTLPSARPRVIDVIAPTASTAAANISAELAPRSSNTSTLRDVALKESLMPPPKVPKIFLARKSYGQVHTHVGQLAPLSTTSRQPLMDLSEMESQVSAGSGKVSDFADSEVEIENLNITIRTLDSTPVRKHQRHHQHMLTQKFLQTRTNLKEKFIRISKAPLILSPKRKCLSCAKLTEDLATKFAMLTTKREKSLNLTCVPLGVTIGEVVQKFQCSTNQAKIASMLKSKFGGFYAPPQNLSGRRLPQETVNHVVDFYLNEFNSKIMPGQRDTILVTNEAGVKERVAKRLILTTLNELFEEFKMQFPLDCIRLTKFSLLRPKQCRWPGPKGHHNTCTCIIHENFKLLCAVLLIYESTVDFLKKVLCVPTTVNCYYGLCPLCPKFLALDEYFKNLADDEVVFYLWETSDRTNLNKIQEPLVDFQQRFKDFVPKIAKHHFVTRQQIDFLDNLMTKIKDEPSAVCHVDFAQNYTFIIQNEVQSAHWNKPQATVHPFVFRWFDEVKNKIMCKSYIVISDHLDHNSLSFHVFRKKVLPMFFHDVPRINKLYYVSDGSAAQYKNYKNFSNLMHHVEDFGIKAEWHFTTTAHGKSTCDAMSAVTKRETRLESLKPGVVITNVLHMFDFCKKKWENSDSIEPILVQTNEVTSCVQEQNDRFSKALQVVGIQQCHSFIPTTQSQMEIRKYSNSIDFETFNFLKPRVIVPSSLTVCVGKYVAFLVENNFQVGVIEEISDAEQEIKINMMKRGGKGNCFKWPDDPTSALHRFVMS